MNGGRLSTAALAYIAGVSGTAVVVAIAFGRASGPGALVGLFVILTGLGMLAHAFPIQGFRHQAYQVTLPFIVTAGPLLLARTALTVLVPRRRQHRPRQARARAA